MINSNYNQNEIRAGIKKLMNDSNNFGSSKHSTIMFNKKGNL